MGDKRKSKDHIIDSKVAHLNKKINQLMVASSLKDNMLCIKELFNDNDTIITREFENNSNENIRYCLFYCEGSVNSTTINENIIKPLMSTSIIKNDGNIISDLVKHVLLVDEIKKIDKIKDIVENVTYGDTILLIDGVNEALVLNTKQFKTRAITEPEAEKILIGPREGFNESLQSNLSLICRRLRTNELKLKYLSLGDKTNTKVCVCYIDSIVDKKILNELYKRLKKIKIDGVIDSNYITELTKDNKASTFRTTGYTEKPDVAVGKLLEGRIAIIVDGSPAVLTIPYLFVENFQNGEDYYQSYYYSSFARLLRTLGFFFTVAIPALYIAVIAFDQEIIPAPLFINIAVERQSVPLPVALEIFIMLLVFDILRETGIRMPSNIGQALSIVGAIVIGQSAVEAKLVAAPVIIIVAFTGITGLLVPRLNSPIIFVRLLLLILSIFLGMFGFVIGISLVIIHILNLKSFGVFQLNLTGNWKFQDMKDTLFRAPWWKMVKRPNVLTNNQTRMKQSGVK